MRNLPILILSVALAACGSDKKDEGAGKAAGQILPASASDAMLPLDTVRSQAPLAPAVAAKPKGDGAADAAATDAVAATDAAPDAAAPAPAETPVG